ncbi:MAG: iron ABC transporter permease [Pseudomonadota bacterium]
MGLNETAVRSRNHGRAFTVGAIALVTVIAAAPLIAALAGAIGAEQSLSDLLSGRNAQYATGTLMLCALAGAGALIIGAGAAIAVSLYDFPGRRLAAVLLVLPFAIPPYIAAYAYGDFFSPFGPVASLVGAEYAPAVRSLPGAAFILALTTYPYIYLALGASLAMRSGALMEAARTLGASPWRATLTVLVAAGRPAIAGGLAVALMEIAADYGVADYFGVSTLSVGIFRTWYGLGDLGAATQLASLLFLGVLGFILLEETGRRGASAEAVVARARAVRIKLSGAAAAFMLAALSLLLALSFAIPAGVLLSKLNGMATATAMRGLSEAALNTALIAGAGAGLVIFIGLILAYGRRRWRSRTAKFLIRIATLGYAVPGAVIAIGLLALTTAVSASIGSSVAVGLSLLIYAYAARFLTIGYNNISGGLSQISPQMDAAAKMLGAGPLRIASSIHFPQMRAAVFAGAGVVAIDIAKELPATLLLRPFNFETLSTRVYRLASDERLAEAAPAALLMIALSLIPVLLLSGPIFNKRDYGATRARDKQKEDPPAPGFGSARAEPSAGS